MSYGRTARYLIASIGLGCGIASTGALAEDAARLEMKAYLNEPGGKQISEGSYAAAVESIEARLGSLSSLDKLVGYNNLCIAKTMLGELEEAETACNSAVRQARRFEQQARTLRERPSATALSNRAVLSIVQGNVEAAIVDLERASALDRSSVSQMQTLALIRQLSSQSFAASD